jgi:hypothetical protein
MYQRITALFVSSLVALTFAMGGYASAEEAAPKRVATETGHGVASPALVVRHLGYGPAACNSLRPIRVDVSTGFGLLLTVCRNANWTALELTNKTVGVVYLKDQNGVANWQSLLPSRLDQSTYAVVSTAVQGGADLNGGYTLLPRSTVVAYANDVMKLTAKPLRQESVLTYAAISLVGWIHRMFQTPAQGFAGSVATCARDTKKFFSSKGRQPEDVIIDALQTSSSCMSLVTQLENATKKTAKVTAVADDIARQSTRVGQLWDDFFRVLNRVATFFPR